MPRRLTLDDMRALAASRGGSCLSTSYRGCFSALIWRCNAGHVWRALPSSVRQGHWCKRCADDRRRKAPDEVRRLAEAQGGKLLSTIYLNSQSRLEWACALGHRWLAIANSIRQGSWCPVCARSPRRTRAALAKRLELLKQALPASPCFGSRRPARSTCSCWNASRGCWASSSRCTKCEARPMSRGQASARALGLGIPPAMLRVADKIID